MESIEKEQFLLELGRKLKQFRKLKGYSNHETLANDLDMTRSQYWEYENGKKNITIFTLKKILDKLNVSLQEFFMSGLN